MHKCDLCGKPTVNFKPFVEPINGIAGRSWCDDCETKFNLERQWENEQVGENIICPWCGYEDPDSWEMGCDYDEDYECINCGKPFVVTRFIEYTSYRKEEDMPEGWDGND